jgi:RNA polymerase sigma factor (sigma-70 family)
LAGNDQELDRWFKAEILCLEPMLIRFLNRHWKDEAEIADLCQEAYVNPKSFLFLTMRNLMIDRLRRNDILAVEMVADLDRLNAFDDEPSPEQQAAARQELRQFQAALDKLPDRCRQVVHMRKVLGLSQREVAGQMLVTEETIEHLLAQGMRLLNRSVRGGPQKEEVRPLRPVRVGFRGAVT